MADPILEGIEIVTGPTMEMQGVEIVTGPTMEHQGIEIVTRLEGRKNRIFLSGIARKIFNQGSERGAPGFFAA